MKIKLGIRQGNTLDRLMFSLIMDERIKAVLHDTPGITYKERLYLKHQKDAN